MPAPGEQALITGNRGEGKTTVLQALFLAYPDGIFINSKWDPAYDRLGVVIKSRKKKERDRRADTKPDEEILRIGLGRYVYYPSQKWKRDVAYRDRTFAWILEAGFRVIALDEIVDIVPSAMQFPFEMKVCVLEGRWKQITLLIGAQEPGHAPSWCFGQAQHIYAFHLGWGDHRDRVEQLMSWNKRDDGPFPWNLIPERSHKFIYKGPSGIWGPNKLPAPGQGKRAS